MKRLLFSFILLFAVTAIYSQSQRLVLLEEFTQASCGPCASVNPTIYALLNSNPDKITSVWYHTNWPGYDPMNLDNPTEVAARVGLYGVTYVPWSVLDGNYYSGSASGWNINTVNTRYAMPSPFSMSMQAVLNTTNDTIFVTMVAEATMDISGSMTAHNVVIEKNIHFNNPPGSNGEKDFKNVMKKMLPSKDGTTLPTSMVTGDYIIVQEAWALDNVYDITQLAAVAFVQSKTSKEVHQSVNSSVNPVVLPYDNDLQVMQVEDFSTTNCSGKITPKVTIRNNGNNTVTAFSLKYRVNSETEATFSWSGSIASLQKTVISLPEYDFTPVTSNILKVYSADPNNVSDEYMKNDTMTYTIAGAPLTTSRIYIFIKTDNAPQETTWDIRNAAGDVVASGGPYITPLTNQKDTVDLVSYDCYTFNLYDAGGNGLCCTNGTGFFYIYDSEDNVISQGNTFGYHVYNEFNYAAPQGLPELKEAGTLAIAPNPSAGDAKAILNLNSAANVKAMLFNSMGSAVKSWDLGVMPSGEQSFALECENMPSGIYILRVMAGKQAMMAKVSVVK
jgi:hypothetical protein